MKTKITVKILGVISLIILSFNLLAQTGKDIMIEFNKAQDDAYYSSVKVTKFTTSKYKLQNGKMISVEKPRVVVLETVLKDYGRNNEETRFLATIKEPVRDKGVSLLSFHYTVPDADDDNWMYLPALGKVRRMVSSSEDDDESASYFGTEFCMEDLSSFKIKNYTFNLVEQTTYENRPVWVLELIPTVEKAKKSMYSKIKIWVDKERYIMLREDLYDHNGVFFKQITSTNVKKIDNVWVACSSQMNNLRTHRATIVEFVSGRFNIEVSDELLTQRALTDLAFREKQLEKQRKYLNN